MAQTLKPGDATSPQGNLTKHDLDRFVADANRHKTNASEHAGFLGQATSQFCERFGCARKAVTWYRTLAGMDRAKGTQVLSEFIAMCEVGGMMEPGLFGTPKDRGAELAKDAAPASDPAPAKEAPKGRSRKGTGATGADIQEALNKEAAAAAPVVPPANDEWDENAPPPPPSVPAPATVQ